MEDEIRSLKRQIRVLQILLGVSLLLSCASFVILARVARQSVDSGWQTIEMFESLSKDQQELRRQVEREQDRERE